MRTNIILLFVGALCWASLTLSGCSEGSKAPDSLIFAVSSEPISGGGRIEALQFTASDGSARFPGAGDLAAGLTELSEAHNPVSGPVLVAIEYGGTSFADDTVTATVTGLRAGAVVAIWHGQIAISEQRLVEITLRAVSPDCDADADGFVDCTIAGCCASGSVPNDCEPADATANPWAVEPQCEPCSDMVDQDCSGEDRPCIDDDSDGVADCIEVEAGCGVADGTVAPGLAELCDDKDNDCDGATDEGIVSEAQQPLGAPCGKENSVCGVGTVVCASDPSSPAVCSTAVLAEAVENCDTPDIDDDCDGRVNEDCLAEDIDGDGFLPGFDDPTLDCNDFDASIYPGAPEPCCDFALSVGEDPDNPSKPVVVECDFDCDGLVSFCAPNDLDGDGSESPADCDDTDPTIYPGAPEKCGDGIDQDCFGGDATCGLQPDDDGDGYANEVDCDDADAAVNPGASELCDGVDNDCDGVVDDGNPEGGGACGKDVGICEPGVLVCGTVQGASALVCAGGNSGEAVEQCDDVDRDCDGSPYNGLLLDGAPVGATCDGEGACGVGSVECSELKSLTCSTNPDGSQAADTPEICDGLDNDCDGETDEDLSLGDSTCLQAGVCADALNAIVANCVAGTWQCNYDAVPEYEAG